MSERTNDVVMRTEDLHKEYVIGDKVLHILRGASFEVRRGEFTAIVGVSGCGKTTLLHMLGLVDSPSAGKIFFEDEDITDLSEKRKKTLRNLCFGFVFQFYHLLPEFTALENTMMPGRIAGTPGRELRKKARKLLERVGLGDRLKHHPPQLSGGERQRVAIARALINDPGLLLCDEPTGNLDEDTGQTIIDLLDELHRERNQTVVLVTHNRDIARHAGRRLVLHEGLIAEEASDAWQTG